MKNFRIVMVCMCIIVTIMSLFVFVACKEEGKKDQSPVETMPQVWEEGFDYGEKQSEDNSQGEPVHMSLYGERKVTIDTDDPYWAMWGSQDLENIYVVDNHPTLKSVDGVLYSKSGETLVRWPAKKLVTKPDDNVKYFAPECYAYCAQFASDFELPDGAISIGNSAFFGSTLTEIHIKKGILTVQDGAISTPSLKKITVSSPKAYRTFFESEYVETIIFNEGVKEILSKTGKVTVLRYLKEVVFPSTLEYIGNVAFPVHVNVSKYTLNDNLNKIDEYAFDTYAQRDSSLYQRNTRTVFVNLNSTAVAYLSRKVPVWDKEIIK